jgi:hypothetical protein
MEEYMKNVLKLLLLVGLVALVAIIPAAAQLSYDGPTVDVKFTASMPFYVGDKLMPAGSYEVRQGAGDQANTLLVRGKGKNEAYAPFMATKADQTVKSMEVSFNKYGDKEFLNAITFPSAQNMNTAWSFTLNPSATEQAAQKAATATKHKVPATK